MGNQDHYLRREDLIDGETAAELLRAINQRVITGSLAKGTAATLAWLLEQTLWRQALTVRFHHVTLGEVLGVSKAHTGKSLRTLVEDGFIDYTPGRSKPPTASRVTFLDPASQRRRGAAEPVAMSGPQQHWRDRDETPDKAIQHAIGALRANRRQFAHNQNIASLTQDLATLATSGSPYTRTAATMAWLLGWWLDGGSVTTHYVEGWAERATLKDLAAILHEAGVTAPTDEELHQVGPLARRWDLLRCLGCGARAGQNNRVSLAG